MLTLLTQPTGRRGVDAPPISPSQHRSGGTLRVPRPARMGCSSVPPRRDRSARVVRGAVTSTPPLVTSPTTAILQPANLLQNGLGSTASSISCTGPGACDIVGYYSGPGAQQTTSLQSLETAGTFSSAQQWSVSLANELTIDPIALFGAIDCFSAGNCVGVGTYADSAANLQAFFGSSSNGSWTFQEVAAPRRRPARSSSHC